MAEPSPPAPSKRLARSDWIEAAIAVMVDSSVENVRVEKLAVDLKASKGSFYWHFKDRGDLLSAILESWQERSTLAVQDRLARAEPDVGQRILRVMQLPFHSHAAARAAELELSIMGWARRSPAARAAVHKVDQVRTDYLVALFGRLGLGEDEAVWRAHQAYAMLRYVAQRGDLALAQRQAMVERLHGQLTADLGAAHPA